MAGWVKPSGWDKLRTATFARWGRQCWRCGAPARSVDHVIPAVLGGGHDLANLRPCCSHCNSSAGATIGNRLRARSWQPPPRSQRAIARKQRRQATAEPASWPTARRW
jgi:5-methylcytosine-specific restriction endonuclease McrA